MLHRLVGQVLHSGTTPPFLALWAEPRLCFGKGPPLLLPPKVDMPCHCGMARVFLR